MLGKILGSFGGFLGNMLGGGVISNALKFAGRYIGNYILQSSYNPDISYSFSPHLENISSNPTNIPYIIPIIFGKAKVVGRIIWSLDFKEEASSKIKTKYFKDSYFTKSEHHHTEYTYFIDFALLLAEGEISEIGRIWINGEESDIAPYQYRFYNGDEEQLPDPLIARSEKIAPAFRGVSYIVFENFPLAEFGNKIPYFEFEVTRKSDNPVTELIRNICIIPGSGEFVYDTELIQKKYKASIGNEEIYREYINCHNNHNIADALYNLDSMIRNFKNLKSVSLVTCWFVDSLDAAQANIYPAIEERDIDSSIEWQVAEYTRQNARIISKDEDNHPNYGGTINDASLIRYLAELKKRGLEILFNPIILLDIPGKAWRGHISGDGHSIRQFFAQYRHFILHYANLTKDYVDSFLIGSELKALTGVREGNIYPAIEELIVLASDVRRIVGDRVEISYGADWSEYHHKDGYYNLDSLWASKDIDFIGISAYFPLTDKTDSEISIQEIKEGFEQGEGFDFYYNEDIRESLDPKWAWKNIRYWWENEHYHMDGQKSPWIPKSKKIYFTEFGFPSIDKASNQPNVFYDPKSFDGGVPKYSNGELDFEIQKKSIQAFLEFWEDSVMVEKSYLWCWDARPQPAWPHMQVWKDSNLWLKGHWVNDKLSNYNLSHLLKEVSIRSGYEEKDIVTNTISENIQGMIINNETSALDTILMLQTLYLFDVRTNRKGQIEFVSNKLENSIMLDSKDLVKEGSILKLKEVTINNETAKLNCSYISYNLDYNADYAHIFTESNSYRETESLNIPLIIDQEKIRYLGRRIIDSRKRQNKNMKFTLPAFYMNNLDIADKICLEYQGVKYRLKVCNIRFFQYKCYIESICA